MLFHCISDDLVCRETDSHVGSDLIHAAQSGNAERVSTILSKESVNPDSKKYYTERGALHLACGYGQTSVINDLLEVNKTLSSFTNLGNSFVCESADDHLDVGS